MKSFNETWTQLLLDVVSKGRETSPRGKLTRELPQHTIEVDIRKPVLTVPERKLNYKFMAAEAFWMLSGDDSVDGVAPWNKNIAQFSDDGERFFGAYGPKIRGQLAYVVNKLLEDPDSRQAVLTIWRENPPQTKDVPCTVAMTFNIRADPRALSFRVLNAHVFMRSNDIWLGTPYDVFNFSMVAHLVTGVLNFAGCTKAGWLPVEPGSLYLTAASSHLYAMNFEQVSAILNSTSFPIHQAPTPAKLFLCTFKPLTEPERVLLDSLKELRESSPGDPLRWWEKSHAAV